MSAETLRRAVARIHHDVEFDQAHGDPAFLLAVAEWLDFTATTAEFGMEPPIKALRVARAYLGESA